MLAEVTRTRALVAIVLIGGSVAIGFAGIGIPSFIPVAAGIAFAVVVVSLLIAVGVLSGRDRYEQTGDLLDSVGHGWLQILKAFLGVTPRDRPEK